ncbi:MAG: hypothetical protein LCH76_10645 [Actinobacteria bacterium]|nr:hypothetical protein [Actinomycetota bacterium]
MNKILTVFLSLPLMAILGGCAAETIATTPAVSPVSPSPSATVPAPSPSRSTIAIGAPSAPSGTEQPPATGGSTATSVPADPGSGCAFSRSDADFFVRDWERVSGSVGRPDHADYTSAMIDTVAKASTAAANCAGSDHLATLTTLIQEIDEAARADEAAGDQIHEFYLAGNEWLVALGYPPNLGE